MTGVLVCNFEERLVELIAEPVAAADGRDVDLVELAVCIWNARK
jgi:hypothetical protein